MAAQGTAKSRLVPLLLSRTPRFSKSLSAVPSFSSIRLLQHPRTFAVSSVLRTDGVFRGLTDGRLPVPWIDVIQRQNGSQPVGLADTNIKERDLTPRKMKESYHRVILPLGRDPWLSDTYINSSGHIRFVPPRSLFCISVCSSCF